MLAIRMQRTGRKGHAMFRVIVQDSRLTPTSGKVVAQLGSYDPHAKTISFDKEKAAFYLDHGAQPSDRVARLFKNEGVKLPDWVKLPADKERTVRNADKRRSTRPAEEAKEEVSEASATEAVETKVEETVIPKAAAEEASAEDAVTVTDAAEVEAAEPPAAETAEADAPETAEAADAADETPAEDAKSA